MGREGALNQVLVKVGSSPSRSRSSGFSTLSVRLAMIQLYILFMITPLFFTLAQVDRTALEAARDLGAQLVEDVQGGDPAPDDARHRDRLDLHLRAHDGRLRHGRDGGRRQHHLVSGRSSTRRSGRSSIRRGRLRPCCSSSLLLVGVWVITRLLEPAGGLVIETMASAAETVARPQDAVVRRAVKRRRDWAKWGLAVYFAGFLFVLYIPLILMAILSFQGSTGQLDIPIPRSVQPGLVEDAVRLERLQHDRRRRQRIGTPVPLAQPRRRRPRGRARVLAVDGVPPPLAIEGRRPRVLHPHARPNDAGLPRRARQPAPLEIHGRDTEPVVHGPRRERDLGDPVLVPRHARGLEPLRPPRRGSGSRPWRKRPDARSGR